MKLVDGSYQATTQVKVLSPENSRYWESRQCSYAGRRNSVERYGKLNTAPRGLSPWHGNKWNCQELGRTRLFRKGNLHINRRKGGCREDGLVVGLTHSTRRSGKPATWGRG
jgi:hypothetical protein